MKLTQKVVFSDAGVIIICPGLCSGPLYRIVPIVVCIVTIIWAQIEMDYNSAENLTEADPIFILMENLFAIFFLTDFIIQSCVVKHPPDITLAKSRYH